MIYVGPKAKGILGGTGCIIDPSLPVERAAGQPPSMSYWPAYGQIAPANRAVYLDWLAAGKARPDAEIGYVFLYFYGLERRLLADRPDADECAALVAEVQRLRSIYATNSSFDGYSQRLLEAVELLHLIKTDTDAATSFDLEASAGHMPLTLAVAIARKVAAEERLPFELATAGLISLPRDKGVQDSVVLRTMRPEFLKLMRARFETAYPVGFLLRNRRNTRLALDYHPASLGLQVELAPPGGHLPDPVKLDWSKFVEFAGRVAAELSPLAKLLASHPERRHSLAAHTMCPAELRDQFGEPARNWLHGLPTPIAAVMFKELAQHAIGKHQDKWTVREHREVCDALSSSGWHMVPDAADGSERLEDDTIVQLVTDPGPAESLSPRFAMAAATAPLVASIARTASDRITEIEESWLDKAQERLTLTTPDIVRLRARLHWLRQSATDGARPIRLLTEATEEDRAFAAWSATITALATRPADKSGLTALETIYDKLQVPRRALYATLHGAVAAEAQTASEPIIVANGEVVPVHAIPSPPVPDPTGLRQDRLRKIRAETDEVDALLASIFAEEVDAPPKPESSPAMGTFAGLDEVHTAFVRRLAAQASWPREDFDAAARVAGLMPEGCLETINEWAFEQFDEALLEEGDPLMVNVALLTGVAASSATPVEPTEQRERP